MSIVRRKPPHHTGFAEAYEENVWRIYGFFAYRLGSRIEAEDLTQLTFERALSAWRRYEPERGPVAAWLMSIARNALIDHWRSKSRERSAATDPERLADLAGAAGEQYVDLGLDGELAAALTTLSPREREIIALRFGGDLTGPEIADLLGLSLANVQQIVSRALRRLRTQLEGTPAPG